MQRRHPVDHDTGDRGVDAWVVRGPRDGDVDRLVVLKTIARRTDMVAADPRAEGARQRNVTMIPRHGCRVVVTAKR